MAMHVLSVVPVAEHALLDPDQLYELNARLGTAGAEDVICRALDALTTRMGRMERQMHQRDYQGLRKSARNISSVALQIGLMGLTHVAEDVVQCIDDGDPIACAATFARLLRMGDVSCSAIWDFQDRRH